ncbi:hypothetical protein Tco_1391293 [Tanacetum coccineum]
MVAVGGNFMRKTPQEAYDLIENMTQHHCQWDAEVSLCFGRSPERAVLSQFKSVSENYFRFERTRRLRRNSYNDDKICQEDAHFKKETKNNIDDFALKMIKTQVNERLLIRWIGQELLLD